jgi:hypothetical protein
MAKNPIKTIERSAIRDKLLESEGKMFWVIFIKKDGTVRRMLARTGVQKGVKGIGMSYDPKAYGLLPIFDMHKHAFRMINLKTVEYVEINKEKIVVVD